MKDDSGMRKMDLFTRVPALTKKGSKGILPLGQLPSVCTHSGSWRYPMGRQKLRGLVDGMLCTYTSHFVTDMGRTFCPR